MAEVLKQLRGHSGSEVYLMKNDQKLYVRKVDNVERNHERMKALFGYVDLPEIYDYNGTSLEMEYIQGQDMKNYFLYNGVAEFNQFITNTINLFAANSEDKDYHETYVHSLYWLESYNNPFPFTADQLVEKLPRVLPRSVYHGDMTLENIIYSGTSRFYFIDPVTVPYDSWVFDIAKMRQDLECKWFLRYDERTHIDVKLGNIQETILHRFPIANNNYLLILMLLRVFKHCIRGTLEYDFIVKEIKRLWK